MRRTARTRRRALGMIITLLATIAVFVTTPAAAEPGEDAGIKKLKAGLEAATKGYVVAKNRLESSKKRQVELTGQVKQLTVRLDVLTGEVAAVAAESYRLGRVGAVSMLLNSASPDMFLQRAAGLELMAQRDDRKIREYTATRDLLDRSRVALGQEIREQQKQLTIMAKKKRDAERALVAATGGSSSGWISANSPLAKPAPRNSDGSWPDESCSVNDPTTSGCITPRTLHALNEAKEAGFRRYVSCYRSGGGGEHPKGRACDFSSAPGGFENASATGDDRTYGNNLAAFYVKNASRLGVYYVIWYRQIWMPSSGWRSYSGGGSPAADHTNHVHLSML